MNTPESAVVAAREAGGVENFNLIVKGRGVRTWPKMNVYNQSDPRHAQLNIDPNWCTGCAFANVHQAMTRKVGEYAKDLYERTKRAPENAEDADKTGAKMTPVAKMATSLWGGEHYRLRTLEEILSWVMIVGPVAVGLTWTQGMEFTTGRGNWWARTFGPKWMANKGDKFGYHCVAIMATSGSECGFVVIENSRGLNWGRKGMARLPWADLEALLEQRKAHAIGVDFPR